MGIGQFRHRIKIQRYTAVQNSLGEEEKTWVDDCKIWASVEPLKGREFFKAQTINAEVTTKITIRYREGISSKMRVVFEGRNFDILSVMKVEERKKEIELMCKELIVEEP
jgi:SPP1 family predicted phage head-tail adaptor